MRTMSKSKQDDKIQTLFNEFVELTAQGMTIEQALAQFDYLHPITFARLKKRVLQNILPEHSGKSAS